MRSLCMKLLSRIGWLGCTVLRVTLIATALIAALWAHDVWEDHRHTVIVKSEIPVFAGSGNESCEGTRLQVLQPGTTFHPQRVRYWKNCATLDMALPGGQKGHIVFGDGVSVSPPLD